MAAVLAALANFAILRAGDETVRVAVAAGELLPGDVLEAASLRFVDVRVTGDVLETLVGPDRAGEAAGAVLVNRVPAGHLVGWSDLTDPGAEAGPRAMSIPIDPSHAVGGRLRVGDRIDVIEVTADGAAFIAVDLQVLDVADRSGAALGGLSPFSVTVAVDAETALRLANAIRSEAIEIVRSTGAGGPAPDVADH
ncbi:MAG: RcpC/CpaB family pilus assembly protein [Nitriliruptorales bacterium]